jgi:hypothetical protein
MHISGERGTAGTPPAVAGAAGALAAARGQVALALAGPLPGGEALLGFVTEASRLKAQAEALELRAAAEVERRRLADQQAATDPAALLAMLTGDKREVARGGLLLARRLEESYHQTLAALACGEISLRAARVIVAAADQIPEWATPEQVAAAEEWLVGKASGVGNRHGRPLNPSRLRQAARRMCAHVCTELADAHEAAMLNKEKRHAEAETWLTLHDKGDGTYSGRFTIPELHGKLLRSLLEQLTSPRRWTRGPDGRPANDPTAQRGFNWAEQLGLGFCELVENLPTGGWSRNGINLVVTMTLDQLRAGVGGAALDDGTRLAAGEARRLACQAGIIPAVLDGNSEPLDLGRTRRLHTGAQRIALSLAHDSCAIVGCERPFTWCEIHHPTPWAHGGPTDLHNAVPLCGYHHRRAHDPMWQLHQDDQGLWRFKSTRLRWNQAA